MRTEDGGMRTEDQRRFVTGCFRMNEADSRDREIVEPRT